MAVPFSGRRKAAGSVLCGLRKPLFRLGLKPAGGFAGFAYFLSTLCLDGEHRREP
jgi:hypothetical protein